MKNKLKSEMLKITKGLIFSTSSIQKIDRWYIPIVYLSNIISNVLQIMVTYTIKLIISSLINNNARTFYSCIGALFTISTIVITVNSILLYKIIPAIDLKITKELKNNIYRINYQKSYDEFSNIQYKNEYFFALENIEQIKSVHHILSSIFASIVGSIGVLIIIRNFNISIISVILIGSILSATCKIKKEKHALNKTITEISSNRELKYIDIILYSDEYAKELRARNLGIILENITKIYKNLTINIRKWSSKLIFFDLISNISSQWMILIAIIILGVETLNHNLNIGSFVMLVTAVQQISGSLLNILQGFPNLVSSSLSLNKLMDYIKKNKSVIKKNQLYKIKSISFKNVHFRYDEFNEIFQKLNLNILEKDKKILIKGKNGIGKSTLIMLMCGLNIPDKGNIYINNTDIISINKASLVKEIDVIF